MLTATKAGRYELLGELGHGAMGVVYRAKDPLIGRTVALKTVRLSEKGTGLTHEQLVERFQNEIRAVGILSHPNIVSIYDAGESDGLYYIALEFLNGKSLEALLAAGEKFSTPRLLHIMEQVCSALDYAHHQNLIHRDIKPANIMLTNNDGVKITDFGTAKIMQYRVERDSTIAGTPGYMSPEQIKGSFVDGRSDIFSLGVMLYEMTTGQRPFTGKDLPTIFYNILNEEPSPPRDVNIDIPLGISSTIMKALAKSPHLRYESCSELIEDLKNFRPGQTEAFTSAVSSLGDSREKTFDTRMPKVPVAAARPASTARPKAAPKPSPLRATTSNIREERLEHIPGVYAGPPSKFSAAAMKRYARIGLGILLVLSLGNYALKNLSPYFHPNADTAPAPQQASRPAELDIAPAERAPEALFVSASNPRIAALADFPEPWASRSFIYSASKSRRVPALLIRLPGSPSESNSYWAFSLEAPFSSCELQYLQELGRISSEYGVRASHPMVVNPCSHTVFDPLQLKETPSNALVRGAIIKGSDIRPPYAIEVKVSGNYVVAIAME